MGLPVRIHRSGQPPVEPLDRRRNGPHAPLRPAPAPPRALAQVLRHLLQLAQRLGLHRLDGIIVVQPQAPLLDELGGAGTLAGQAPGLERQGHGVQRLRRRIQQQTRDIKRALLVFEHGRPSLER
jgi:hypothetical protein